MILGVKSKTSDFWETTGWVQQRALEKGWGGERDGGGRDGDGSEKKENEEKERRCRIKQLYRIHQLH
eukprot:751286-Hanusia_phi.AAC.2